MNKPLTAAQASAGDARSASAGCIVANAPTGEEDDHTRSGDDVTGVLGVTHVSKVGPHVPGSRGDYCL
jgi:hypothetical protein